jgi:hypothetical protein
VPASLVIAGSGAQRDGSTASKLRRIGEVGVQVSVAPKNTA